MATKCRSRRGVEGMERRIIAVHRTVCFYREEGAGFDVGKSSGGGEGRVGQVN